MLTDSSSRLVAIRAEDEKYVDTYGQEYFDNYGHKDEKYLESRYIYDTLAKVADKIAAIICPKTALDVGCAFGYLVAELRRYGIKAEGVDVSEYAISLAVPGAFPYCHWASASNPELDLGKFDIVICIEVLEHLEELDALAAIDFICRSSSAFVFFSSSPHDTDEPTHINVHPQEYWREQFENRGFKFYPHFKTTIDWSMLFMRKELWSNV